MKKSVLIVSVALLFLAMRVKPGGADSKPDWVDGLSPHYPQTTYLTGVGFGDDRQAAQNSAYAAISRIFRSEISSVAQEEERFRQTEESEQETRIDRTVDIQSQTAIHSKIVLEQIQIVEHWIDPVSKVRYALAVLNRSRASSSLRQKHLEAEQALKTWEARAKEAETHLAAAKALYKAVGASKQADEYQNQLRVIDPGKPATAEQPGRTGVLEGELQKLLGQYFQVAVELSGDHAEEVGAAILEGLTRKGFASGPDAKLIISGTIRFEETGPKSPVWHFVRWSTRIALTEKESGQVFGSIRRTGREGQLSAKEAEQKSLAALQSELDKMIGKTVVQFIFGE